MDTEIREAIKQLGELKKEADYIYGLYAEAKTSYDNLKKWEPVVLMEEASKLEGTEAKRKREATATDAYKTHLTALDKMRGEYNIAEGKKNALELKLSALQTISKLLLAEIKLTPYEQN